MRRPAAMADRAVMFFRRGYCERGSTLPSIAAVGAAVLKADGKLGRSSGQPSATGTKTDLRDLAARKLSAEGISAMGRSSIKGGTALLIAVAMLTGACGSGQPAETGAAREAGGAADTSARDGARPQPLERSNSDMPRN